MNGKNRIAIWVGLLVFVGTISFPSVAENTYYRWKDDRGNPVHSDRPPPEGLDYEVVTTGTSLVRKVDADEGVVPADLDSVPGNEFERVETAKREVKKNPETCNRAKDNLTTLDTHARIRVRDNKGDYRYIDEEEKAEQRAQAEEQIRIHCE
ncbi:MAG: DUF4124 domain-containing protein [Halioglobus sp.]